MVTKSILENPRLRNVVVGSLLGDLNMQLLGSNFRIRAVQSVFHKDWIFKLGEELSSITPITPKLDKYDRYWFNTRVSEEFHDLNQIGFAFYPNATAISSGKKIVPREIVNWLDEPVGLAAWYMDDGSKRTSGYILCTDCFEIDEVEYLQYLLSHNFDLTDTSINFKDNKPRLRIKAGSADKFRNLIQPYLVPSMLYKI